MLWRRSPYIVLQYNMLGLSFNIPTTLSPPVVYPLLKHLVTGLRSRSVPIVTNFFVRATLCCTQQIIEVPVKLTGTFRRFIFKFYFSTSLFSLMPFVAPTRPQSSKESSTTSVIVAIVESQKQPDGCSDKVCLD